MFLSHLYFLVMTIYLNIVSSGTYFVKHSITSIFLFAASKTTTPSQAISATCPAAAEAERLRNMLLSMLEGGSTTSFDHQFLNDDLTATLPQHGLLVSILV